MKWEYEILVVPVQGEDNAIASELCEVGRFGWEAVAATTTYDYRGQIIVYTLKRPLE